MVRYRTYFAAPRMEAKVVYNFVDVGAHNGIVAEKVASLGIQVHAFEPNPKLMEGLQDRLGGLPNVTLYEQAWDKNRRLAIMYTPEPESQSSSLYIEKKTSPGAAEVLVDTIDGAEFLRGLEGDIILFSNCEGSEFDFVPEILKDAELCQRIKLWAVSFHHGQHKIPTLRPQYEEIYKQMVDKGIFNVHAHYDNNKKGEIDAFVETVRRETNE